MAERPHSIQLASSREMTLASGGNSQGFSIRRGMLVAGLRVMSLKAVRLLEAVSEHLRLVGENLGGRSLGDDSASVQDHHPAARLDDQLEIVGGHHLGHRQRLEEGSMTTRVRAAILMGGLALIVAACRAAAARRATSSARSART